MRREKILTTHYGLHLSPDGLWFLLQDGEQNARNLDVRSPFTVKADRVSRAPHAIQLADRSLTDDERSVQRRLVKSKLGRQFLPLPTTVPRMTFLPQTPARLEKAFNIKELGSPVGQDMFMAPYTTMPSLKVASNATNILPLILTHIDVKWMSQNQMILDMLKMGKRNVILMGSEDVVIPPGTCERIDGRAFDRLPDKGNLRSIGANTAYKFMRNEL